VIDLQPNISVDVIPEQDSDAAELAVLQQLAKGSEQAFTILYKRYWIVVYNFVRKVIRSEDLAEDIAQDIFIRLWQRRESFAEVRQLRHFLDVTSRNQISSVLDKLANQTAAHREFVYTHGRHLPDTTLDDLISDKDYLVIVQEAMNELPPTQKKVFGLSKMEGLSHEGIAEHLCMSREAVKKNMMRALQYVRRHLNKYITGILLLGLPAWLGL